jgi:hypothetical protein
MLLRAGHAKPLAGQKLAEESAALGQKLMQHGHGNKGKPNLGCRPNDILAYGQRPK